MEQIQDQQFELLAERLQAQENRLAAAAPADKHGIVLLEAKLIEDYLDLLEAELRSLAAMSEQVKSRSEIVGAPGDRHIQIESEYHRNLRMALKREISRKDFATAMLKSGGFRLPWSIELLRAANEIIANDRHDNPDEPGLDFTLDTFLAGLRPQAPAETLDGRLFVWALNRMSNDITIWSLQIFGGRLPEPGKPEYFKRLSFFAYENTPLHNQLVHEAGGKKASKMPTANLLEPVDGSPVGKGIPFDPEDVARQYARVLAQAALKVVLHVVEKPAWNFMFLTAPRYYRQAAYLQSVEAERRTKERKQTISPQLTPSQRRALYRISPLERTVATAVRTIAVGVASGIDLSSEQGKLFAERFVRMLPRRMVPSQLWKNTLAAVYEFLLPHDEVRREFALELLGLLRHPEGLGTFADKIDELFPTRDVIANRLERMTLEAMGRGEQQTPESVEAEFVRLRDRYGFSDELIWLTRDYAGSPVIRGYTAVDYDRDRRSDNLAYTIENSLKTSTLLGWFRHVSKLWTQTAQELGITKSELENLSDGNFSRMIAGMGLVNTLFRRYDKQGRVLLSLKERKDLQVEDESSLMQLERVRRDHGLRFSPNKAWHHPYRLRYEDEDGQVRQAVYRTKFEMANGRIQLTVMETCWLLMLHHMGDITEIHDVDLGRQLMTRTTIDVISGFSSFNASDPSFNLSRSRVNVQKSMMQAELEIYQRALSEQPMDEFARLTALKAKLDELNKKYDLIAISQAESAPDGDAEKPAPASPQMQKLVAEIAQETHDPDFAQIVERALAQVDALAGTPAWKRQGALLVETIDRRIAMQQQEAENPLPQTAVTKEILSMALAGQIVQGVPTERDESPEIREKRKKAEWYAWLWNRYMEDEEEVRVSPYPEPQVDPELKKWFEQQEGNR